MTKFHGEITLSSTIVFCILFLYSPTSVLDLSANQEHNMAKNAQTTQQSIGGGGGGDERYFDDGLQAKVRINCIFGYQNVCSLSTID